MGFNIVIDASVAVKWHIKDESEVEQAIEILLDYNSGKVGFIEPHLFYYETSNAVNIAVQRKRITEDEGRDIIKDMLEIEMAVVDNLELIRNAYGLARKYNISVYDAIYLETAKENGTLFYTGDRKFYNSMKGKKDFLRWIGDYRGIGD